MESLNTLYKQDSKGKTRSWTVQYLGDSWRTVAGIHNGTMVTSEWRKAEPKNVGKKNETTGSAQALLECAAKHQKRLESGYFADVNDIGNSTLFKPMLATDFAKLKKPLQFPVISQPKLDGIRCIARADGLWSRSGKAHISVPHIWDALKNIFIRFPNLVLDGELYNHDLKDDFNSIVSMVRKSKPTPEDIALSAQRVQYHVYDTYNDEDFAARRLSVVRICRMADSYAIHPVPNRWVESLQDLDLTYGEYIGDGYEGQMIRIPTSLYENKRSNNLMKRKEFITAEFNVHGVEEGLGNWSGCVKRFNLYDGHGLSFNAGVRGTQAQLGDLLKNKPCPTWATLRYFELTPDGVPRFPVVIDYGWGERLD